MGVKFSLRPPPPAPPRKGDIRNEFQKDAGEIMRISEGKSYRRMYKTLQGESVQYIMHRHDQPRGLVVRVSAY